MRDRSLIGALALVATWARVGAALCAGMVEARAFDDTRYPDFKGQWRPSAGRCGSIPTSRGGRASRPR